MGIVYTNKIGRGYINTPTRQPVISRSRATKALTRRSIQFLLSQGLRVVPGGK